MAALGGRRVSIGGVESIGSEPGGDVVGVLSALGQLYSVLGGDDWYSGCGFASVQEGLVEEIGVEDGEAFLSTEGASADGTEPSGCEAVGAEQYLLGLFRVGVGRLESLVWVFVG